MQRIIGRAAILTVVVALAVAIGICLYLGGHGHSRMTVAQKIKRGRSQEMQLVRIAREKQDYVTLVGLLPSVEFVSEQAVAAILSCTSVSDERKVKDLIEAFGVSSNHTTRSDIAVGLGRIGGGVARDFLAGRVNFALEEGTANAVYEMKASAQALLDMRDPEATELFVRILGNKHAAFLKPKIYRLLGELGDGSATRQAQKEVAEGEPSITRDEAENYLRVIRSRGGTTPTNAPTSTNTEPNQPPLNDK